MSQNHPRGRGRGRGRVGPVSVPASRGILPRGRGRGAPTQPALPVPTDPHMARQEAARQYVNTILANWVPHPLPPAELASIRRDCDLRLRRLNDLQARPPEDMSPADRDNLQAAIFDYQVRSFRLFRVNDLPSEILSNILRFVVWSAPTPGIGIRWRLELTWVCKHWRHAAISDSTLWNAIWFRDPPPFTRSLAFVERSGHSPLDLRINDGPDKPYTDAEVRPVLQALTPHLHHIRMLIILFERWEPILSVLQWLDDYGRRSMRNECIPLSMERFEIHRTGSPYMWPGLPYEDRGIYQPEGHDVTVYPLFGGANVPALVSFTVNGVHINWEESPSITNLTTLDIRRIPLDRCPPLLLFREVLLTSPRLTKLSLDGAGPGGNPNAFSQLNLPSVDLPLLHTLVLANFAAQFTSSIVSHFTAPNVKDLTVMNFRGDGYGPFYQYVTGRFPHVRILTLYSISCPPHVLVPMIKWLDSMPMLTYLRCAAVTYDALQIFLFEPDDLIPHPALNDENKTTFQMVDNPPTPDLTEALTPPGSRDENQPPRPLASRMTILEVQNILPDVFAMFINLRKVVGAPVKKIYMARAMMGTFTPQVFEYVRTAVPEVLVVDIGAKTPEEDELLRED